MAATLKEPEPMRRLHFSLVLFATLSLLCIAARAADGPQEPVMQRLQEPLEVHSISERIYPHGNLAAHLIGWRSAVDQSEIEKR